MPKPVSHKLFVKSIETTGFTLNSVSSDPRRCLPLDLKVACASVAVEPAGAEVSSLARRILYYLLTEFFALSHKTGLYNRQRKLWDALACVTEADVLRLEKGLLKKTALPIIDLNMHDRKGQIVILARIIESTQAPGFDLTTEKDCKNILESTVAQAEKLYGENNSFTGFFLCCPAPFPESIKLKVEQLTQAHSALGRYESILPGRFGLHTNLLSHADEGITLVHPNLQRL